MLGRTLDAAEALEWGLVDRVVERDQLEDEARAQALASAASAERREGVRSFAERRSPEFQGQ